MSVTCCDCKPESHQFHLSFFKTLAVVFGEFFLLFLYLGYLVIPFIRDTGQVSVKLVDMLTRKFQSY